MLESLESRRLLTVTLSAPDAGVLRLVSNGQSDVVETSLAGSGGFDLKINGTIVESYGYDDVDTISFDGGAGSDTIIIGKVPVALLAVGGAGNDTLSASSADGLVPQDDDDAERRTLADTVYGNGGEDYLFGGIGDDRLDGGIQGDVIVGGAGDDFIVGGSANTLDDVISGGAGTDTVDFIESDGRVNVIVGQGVAGNAVSDVVYGDVEVIYGTDSNDIITTIAGRALTIYGRAGNDQLTGGSKNDVLVGGPGDDVLSGNGGDDLLDADGGGTDILNGGTGDDRAINVISTTTVNSATIVTGS